MLKFAVIIYLTLTQEENIETQQNLLASVCSIWSKEHINWKSFLFEKRHFFVFFGCNNWRSRRLV